MYWIGQSPAVAVHTCCFWVDDWFARLSSGRISNVTEIATEVNVSNPYVIRVLHPAFLAPDIVQRFQEGNYPTLQRPRLPGGAERNTATNCCIPLKVEF